MTRTRDDIELDLVFAVNGTLTEAEQAQMQEWLAHDVLLLSEHDALVAVRAQMQAEDVQSPGAFGLARLLRDVGRDAGFAASSPAPNRTGMWRLAAAVAVIALMGQALFLRNDSVEGGYQMAGAEPAAQLVVSFAPDATEAQIRAVLVQLELEIVAGPSALGFYSLDVLAGANQTAAFEGLRRAEGIIESVEDARN